MDRSFDLSDLSTFACGTEGPTGARIFYLQARTPTETVTLKVEKQQVSLLADYLEQLMAVEDLPDAAPAHMPDLDTPAEPEWTVGSLLVAVNRSTGQVIVIAEKLLDESTDPAADAAEARFALTPGQVEAFVSGARRIVGAGRPVCPLCNGPIDPAGHACPRMN